MGFFSSLWNGVTEVVKTAVAVAVAPVVLPVAGVMYAADKIKDALSSTSKKVEEKVKETNQNIGKSGALNETSSARQVEDISNLLYQYHKQYRPVGENVEDTCKKCVRDCFDELIKKLRKDEKLADSFGLEQIQRKKNRLCGDIDGAITDAIRKNLSLDNSQCVAILKLPAGSDKQRKMENFAKKVIDDAKDDLAHTVSRTMNQVTDDISNFLQDYIDNQERAAERETRNFEQWKRDMENQTFDREKAQLPALQKLYALEQIEKILAA